jgi:hypothetical protein
MGVINHMMQDMRERESPSDDYWEATHNVLTQDIPPPMKFVRPQAGEGALLKAMFKLKLLLCLPFHLIQTSHQSRHVIPFCL